MAFLVSLRHNARGSHVREIQTLLNQHGAHLTVDGIFGPNTDAAVRAFQASHGLTVDGIVGSKTLAALKGGNTPPLSPPSSGSASVQGILNRARSQLGVGENPAGSNRTQYGAWYGMDGQPWCAMFVSWVFYHEGMPLSFTTSKGFAYCAYGVKGFKEQGRWHTSNPQPGDVVFFNWDGGRVDHVGIVEAVNGDGSITTLEGNTDNNRVESRRRSSKIVGYGRPKF